MLKKRLSCSKLVVRSGVAFETPWAASRRSSVNGRAARTKGRISSRRIGVVSRRNGVTAAFVSSSLRIGERSDSSDERSTGANSRTSLSAASEARSAPGRRATEAEMFWSSLARASNTAPEADTSRLSCSGRRPTCVINRP